MDIDMIFSLMDKAEKSSFNKIKIQMQDVEICLERDGVSAAPAMQKLQKETVLSEAYEQEPDYDEDIVYAPIPGVFYVAKEPGKEPFVREGGHVNKGEPICIIEAMKMMNEICAPKSGVIERVFKEDGQAITVNDALFRFAKE